MPLQWLIGTECRALIHRCLSRAALPPPFCHPYMQGPAQGKTERCRQRRLHRRPRAALPGRRRQDQAGGGAADRAA